MRRKILLAVFFGSALFAFSFSAEVLAQSPSSVTLLSPLPGTTGSTDLETYLPLVFNLAIGIAGVLAVIMIIIGGLQYMSTDAIGGKQEGKNRITAALGGLLLALVAYIILQTINPKLVNFNLPSVTVTVPRSPASTGTSASAASGPCKTPCVVLSGVAVSPRACVPESSTCTIQLNQTVADRTQLIDAALKSDPRMASYPMRVTEGWPPTVKHDNLCHKDGTCIDYGFAQPGKIGPQGPSPSDVNAIKAIIETAAANDSTAVFEFGTAIECNRAVARGVPAGNILMVKGVSPHASIYTNGVSGSTARGCNPP